MKLKTKILIPVLLVLILSISILGLLSYTKSKDMILNQLYTQGDNQLNLLVKMIEGNDFDQNLVLHELKIGETGYAYIVNSKGIISGHPNEKDVGLNLGDYEWGKEILAIKNGNLTYEYGGFEKYSVFQEVDGNIVVVAIPMEEFLSPLAALRKNTFSILAISILISSLSIMILLNKVVISPVNQIVMGMEKVGDGNLNTIISIDKQDEIGQMAKYFNEMTGSMKRIVTNVNNTITEANKTSEMISRTTEETTLASEEISKTIEEIASGATNQASETGNTLQTTNSLDAKVNDMIKRLSMTSDNTKHMESNNKVGTISIKEFKELFESYSLGAKKVTDNVYTLSDKSETIGKIVQSINNISSQTNLLALNAAIEAARAGEAGRGFGVVADEIRKLAEQSERSANEIQVIIEEIKEVINDTNRETRVSEELLNKSKVTLADTEKAFMELDSSIGNVAKQIEMLHTDIDNVDILKNDVLNSIERISAVSQETAAATEEISASTEEQTAAMEEVAASIQELNDMMGRLSKEIQAFNI